MTDTPEPFVPADAFDGTDPVDLIELSGEQRAWRAVMHLLAEHGDTVHLPPALAPDALALEVAAGWNYRPTLHEAGGVVTLSCTFTGWNPNRPASLFGAPPDAADRARAAAEKLPTVGQWPGDTPA